MRVFYTIFGVVMGLILNQLILKPIQRKKARDECVRDGLVPWDY